MIATLDRSGIKRGLRPPCRLEGPQPQAARQATWVDPRKRWQRAEVLVRLDEKRGALGTGTVGPSGELDPKPMWLLLDTPLWRNGGIALYQAAKKRWAKQ